MENKRRIYSGQETLAVSERERRGRAMARRAAAEGMVLLENNGVLPLKPGAKLALFGVGARHTVKGGTGSGDVNARDVVCVDAGLRSAGFNIVNDDYLDAFDRAYVAALADWEKAIYAATEGQRDFNKLYHAHATLSPKLPDLPIPEDACADAEAVVYVISRISGEAVDRRAEKGDYYLTDLEREQLAALCATGRPLVVVLNVGGVIDLAFMDELPVAALVLMSQAGSEGGSALADVLSGAVNPSGRLTDTWAVNYGDYPSSANFSHRNGNTAEEYYTDGIYVGYRYFDAFGVKPRYPFGYGLSYTAFESRPVAARLEEGGAVVEVEVRNTGSVPGRQVIQLYAACPDGRLTTEAKRLAAFGKTGLLAPNQAETLPLRFDLEKLASYHEGQAAYILQAGGYALLAGESSERWQPVARLTLGETVTLRRLTNICELLDALVEIQPGEGARLSEALDGAAFPLGDIAMDEAAKALAARIASEKTAREPEGLAEAREIARRMTDEQKARLVVGAPSAMSGEVVGAAACTVPGAAGETVGYPELGVPRMVLADGPAGVRVQQRYEIDPASGEIYRLDRFATLENRFFGKLETHEGALKRYQFATAIPVGTLLAQSFDPALLEEVGTMIADELRAFNVRIWLAPGMNIHRNPLCGRNFEYFSEDPLISGVMAAAITRGVQRAPGLGVSIKHFACNNQEDDRMHTTAIVSERALREIYLKGFEIAVRTAQPMTIMTSYNRVNGVHAANSCDLCTTAAREEWGFEGFIMTDWTTTNAGHGSSAAKCVLAGNDLVMPGRDSDRVEILAALHGERAPKLPQEALDEAAARIIRAARLGE